MLTRVILTILTAATCLVAHDLNANVVTKGEAPLAVVFASERIGDDWIPSFFTAADQNGFSFNECESSVMAALYKMGFDGPVTAIDNPKFTRVRSFSTVVGRYREMSSIPNFTATKAAMIVSGDSRAAVLCDVKVAESKDGEDNCAKARCKSVDVSSNKRIFASTFSYCGEKGEPSTSRVAAVKGVCGKLGSDMGTQMIKFYEDERGGKK